MKDSYLCIVNESVRECSQGTKNLFSGLTDFTACPARKNGRFERNNLGVIAQALGISAEGAHRAMADVRMTEKVLYCFLHDFAQAGIVTWEEVCACQFKRCEKVVLGQTVFPIKK